MRFVSSLELVGKIKRALRQPEIRLQVVCAPEAVLALARMVGLLRAGPWLDTPHLAHDCGWAERASDLDAWKQTRVNTPGRSTSDSPAPEEAARPEGRNEGRTLADAEARGFESFLELLGNVADERDHAAIVLAPRLVVERESYQAQIESMLERDEAKSISWIFIDPGQPRLVGEALAERFGIETIGWTGGQRAHQELVRAIEEAVAERGVLPPEMEEFLPADAFLRTPRAERLREALWQAHREMELGVLNEAEALYDFVANELHDEGQPMERLHTELGRARMLIAADRSARARRVIAQQIDYARTSGLKALLPELYASLGGMHAAERRFADAFEAYSMAATLSQDVERPLVTAECLRCAGHAALNGNRPGEGLDAWRKALLALGLDAPPARGRLEDDIVLTALLLADAFQKEARLAAAAALRGHAGAIEERRPTAPKS